MHRSRRWISLAVAGVALSSTAACSSGTAQRGAADSAFLTKANAACETTLANTGSSPFPYPDFDGNDPDIAQLPTVGKYFDGLRFSHEETAFVKSFGKPRQGRSSWSAFVELVTQQQDLVEKQIVAAKAADKPRFVATVAAITELETRIATAGGTVGFKPDDYCLQLF
jgi:hypothetical protein